MLVQRVLLPATRRESWTVLGEDGPVQPIERYLAYLTDIERSPNTVRAYAHDLKDWFVFLAGQGLDWRGVRLEDVAGFVAWLRRPPAARDGAVAVLPSVEHHCGASTVNRKLSALSAFYQHAARSGVDLGELLVTWQPAGRRGTAWKPFLHHVTKGQPQARRTVALKAARKLPRVLTAGEVQAILDACDRLRDRLLFAVLYETGIFSSGQFGHTGLPGCSRRSTAGQLRAAVQHVLCTWGAGCQPRRMAWLSWAMSSRLAERAAARSWSRSSSRRRRSMTCC